MATSPIVTSGFLASTALVVTAGFLSGATPTPPTPTPVVVATQTFQGFGGGFLGPHHNRKREELYAKAQVFGPPPVYRFKTRDLLPAILFKDALTDDGLLRRAILAGSAVDIKPQPGVTIKGLARVKLTGLNEYYRDEKKRKLKKRQKEEDELMLLL